MRTGKWLPSELHPGLDFCVFAALFYWLSLASTHHVSASALVFPLDVCLLCPPMRRYPSGGSANADVDTWCMLARESLMRGQKWFASAKPRGLWAEQVRHNLQLRETMFGQAQAERHSLCTIQLG